MSAMTGPRHSPSSPWHQDPQNQPQTTHFPLRDVDRPTLDARANTTVPEKSGSSYFSFGVNHPGNAHDLKQSLHTRNDWDAAPFTQFAKSALECSQADSLKSRTSGDNNRKVSVLHGLPWNHELQRVESSERPVTLQSASKSAPAQNVGQTFGLRPQDSRHQASSQPPRPFQMRFQPAPSTDNLRTATTDSGSHLSHSTQGANLVSPERCAELLDKFQYHSMFLDVRPFSHFVQANIKGSLNICIPTTLLKRPSFDTRKLEDTFTDDDAKSNFARWRQCCYIVIYDAATGDTKDAGPLLNVLRKFTAEGWDGEGMVLHGGFKTFSDRFPNFVQHISGEQSQAAGLSSEKPTSMHLNLPAAAPVAGGCALPESSATMIPFFGNIRQHMDLLGGVGQIPLQLPRKLTESKRRMLPTWLRDASNVRDQGRNVSEKFLGLEEMELERMKHALSYKLDAEAASSKKFRIAGIEMGTKNRYNDIYPFDHSRVQLQNEPIGGCDYVNANHIKAENSNKKYIATQAPVPDTFNVSPFIQSGLLNIET